jgi:hypothetical protein
MADESPRYWWQAPDRNAHREVFATADRICQQQQMQRETIVDYLEMYSNGNVAGLGLNAEGSPNFRRYFYQRGSNAAPRFNISAAVVDTVVSMVAYNPPIPQYLTTGADYGLIRKAKKKTRVLQGQMHHLGEPLCRRGFRDACKTGLGAVWGGVGDDGLPKIERVSMLELLVEHMDGIYQTPLSIHRTRSCVSKEWLLSRYPKKDLDQPIRMAGADAQRTLMNRFLPATWAAGQMCDLIESIHLPVGDRPGRRTLCVSTATLEDEEWEDEQFPVALWRYRERDFGFYGSGLIEAAYETQMRVDDLCERNAKSQRLASTMKLINPNGEGTLKKSQITNEIGEVYDINGDRAVQVITYSGTLDDLQAQIDLELNRLLFVEGISASQAAGDGASQGLTSGVAIRAEEDSRASRMVSPIEMYQRGCLETAKLIERLNDRVAKKKPSFVPSGKLKSGRQTFLNSSTWRDLTIPRGQVEIDMFPMSSLPNSPSGRYAAVMEWIEGGFASREYGMQLLGFPDIDSYADVQLAYIDLVQWQIEQIVDEEKRMLPIPRQDFAVAVDLGQRALCRATMVPGMPSSVLENLDAYVTRAEALLAKAQKAAEPVPDPNSQGGAVQGAGGDPRALQGQAPALPGPGPQMVA